MRPHADEGTWPAALLSASSLGTGLLGQAGILGPRPQGDGCMAFESHIMTLNTISSLIPLWDWPIFVCTVNRE